MSCDEYIRCPKCKKFESLKIWYNNFDNLNINTNKELIIKDFNKISGLCCNCDFYNKQRRY